jgi:hypothetical protein
LVLCAAFWFDWMTALRTNRPFAFAAIAGAAFLLALQQLLCGTA